MSSTYAYVRLSPKYQDFEAHVAEIKAAYPSAQLFQETGVKGYVPVEERPVYQIMYEQMQEGDTLVVWWIGALGRDFERCRDAINGILNKGVCIQTINQNLLFRPNCEMTGMMMKLLTGYAEADSRHRLAAAKFGREALRDDPDEWKQKFRGRRANKELHRLIASLLLEGKTLQEAAEGAQTSVSTVKRVKAKLSEMGEAGELRRRHKHHQADGDENK
ncbi:recombinase family protein [Photobacterium makurazakiensis]|uniref:recombinase family protein n=1 Tax=Photobacterium TaxID=657 RepID=UPI003D13A861